ncbi:MAG: UDP-N-acetylmuramoyl-L-alanine--D-glutamate ligase [Deferrisomatales bacterium]|nr:UDP-N-acetylmuramoyl-L-alanine--D-glutamate ligase [Deferrisomatales bacterium]
MRDVHLKGRKAIVVGAGVSGLAAARLLLARDAAVDLYDDAPRERLRPEVAVLEAAGAQVLAGGATPDPTRYDLAVVSPGISADAAVLQTLAAAGVERIAEVELAFRLLTAPVLAITGTNGKTTTVELLGRVFADAGRSVFVGGNVGTPLSDAVGDHWDAVVAEVSSFQLETVDRFRPRVAVLLNLTDDHLDRHPDRGAYAAAKARLFANQGPGDAAVVNADDPAAWALKRPGGGVLLPYSTRRMLPVGAWLEGAEGVVLLPGRDGMRFPAGELRLPGEHNRGNALAACLAAAWVGIDPGAAWRCAQRFEGLGHRIERFLEWRGVQFVDDSKATNVGAAVSALQTVAGPVVWVAGGVDKGGDYGPLVPVLQAVARQVILVGEAAEQMAGALHGAAPLLVAPGWPAAVSAAVSAAHPGDTVLLAPACSSFDHFSGYAQRGEVFQRLCREETGRRDAGGH